MLLHNLSKGLSFFLAQGSLTLISIHGILQNFGVAFKEQ